MKKIFSIKKTNTQNVPHLKTHFKVTTVGGNHSLYSEIYYRKNKFNHSALYESGESMLVSFDANRNLCANDSTSYECSLELTDRICYFNTDIMIKQTDLFLFVMNSPDEETNLSELNSRIYGAFDPVPDPKIVLRPFILVYTGSELDLETCLALLEKYPVYACVQAELMLDREQEMKVTLNDKKVDLILCLALDILKSKKTEEQVTSREGFFDRKKHTQEAYPPTKKPSKLCEGVYVFYDLLSEHKKQILTGSSLSEESFLFAPLPADLTVRKPV
jgi:hypothetical protein